MSDAASCVEVPCVDCSQPISIYPPEDGHGQRWRCGRCGRTPTATRADFTMRCEICDANLDPPDDEMCCRDDDCTDVVTHCLDHCTEACVQAPAAAAEIAAGLRRIAAEMRQKGNLAGHDNRSITP